MSELLIETARMALGLLFAALLLAAMVISVLWIAAYLSMYRWRRSIKEWWES